MKVAKIGHNLLKLMIWGFATTAISATYPLNVDDMFVPNGFDDNDGVEIVLDGWLQSSCDTVLEPKVTVDFARGTIKIEPKAIHGVFECLPMKTRYTVTTHIGALPYGDYDVITNNGWLVKHLFVEEASNAGPDDYIYANVLEAFVDYAPDDKTDNRWAVVMIGKFTNSCQKWASIEIKKHEKTFTVLPKLRTEGELCAPVIEPFTTRVPLEDPVDAERYLAHIRVQKGKAINVVFTGH